MVLEGRRVIEVVKWFLGVAAATMATEGRKSRRREVIERKEEETTELGPGHGFRAKGRKKRRVVVVPQTNETRAKERTGVAMQ